MPKHISSEARILVNAGAFVSSVWLVAVAVAILFQTLSGLPQYNNVPFAHIVLYAIFKCSTAVMIAVQIIVLTVWVSDIAVWLSRYISSRLHDGYQLTGQPGRDEAYYKACAVEAAAAEPSTTDAAALTLVVHSSQTAASDLRQPLLNTSVSDMLSTPTRPFAPKQQQLMHPAISSAAACADAAAEHDDGIVDVWVLAGQSNCVGWNQADGQDMPAAAAPCKGRVLKFDREEGSWQTAVPNVHVGVYGYADADSCGPDMAFARTLIQTGTARKVGLVPTACGGTNLFEQWAPGGELWSNMVADTTAALDQLGSRGRLAGIIWVQGESDAGSLETAAAYGDNFTAWLSATRGALQAHCSCVPVVIAVMATRQREQAFPFISVVAEQQRALKAPAVLKVDMAGYEFYDAGDGSLVHLTKAGCCALGVAMAFEVAAVQHKAHHLQ